MGISAVANSTAEELLWPLGTACRVETCGDGSGGPATRAAGGPVANPYVFSVGGTPVGTPSAVELSSTLADYSGFQTPILGSGPK
jgi:hypothetical protein